MNNETWPGMIIILAGPYSMSDGPPQIIEPCPKCKGRDIRYSQSRLGMRCECMGCKRYGRTIGPPASNDIKGDSPARTMWLRRDEAYRLWNYFANASRFVTT